MTEENLPYFLGGNCKCEGDCMYANDGPWKLNNKI